MNIQEISSLIKSQALSLGFDACGFASVQALEEDARYLSGWINKGYAGEMGYMNNYFEKRTNPALLVENAQSVIVVLLNYFPSQISLEEPRIAKYSYGSDYHYVVKQKLRQLKAYIDENIHPCRGECFCDSAPVFERRWAERAGLGWIGKNTNLINKQLGSFFFIGEIILDLELEYDKPMSNYCGNCTRCIDACPTNAILEPFTLDASRCISYQTIEKRGNIDEEIATKLSGCLFGCDICQDVCPWNKKCVSHHNSDLDPISGLLEMNVEDWLALSKPDFNKRFKYSPLKRAGYEKIIKTVTNIKER
jgi:epoxyqueuosine reductase